MTECDNEREKTNRNIQRKFQRRLTAWANLAKLTDDRLWPVDIPPQSTNTRYRLAYWHCDPDAGSPLATIIP
jgi:hypothetical protein